MRSFFWMMGTLLFSTTGIALPTVVPDPIPCYQHLATHFFAPEIVDQSLSLYGVRQEIWVPIFESIQYRNLGIPERMKRRTAFMVPNPLEYPMNRAVTGELLKKVLFEVLVEALVENYAGDVNAQGIFEYILSQQRAAFDRCFGHGSTL